ncbi:uncharacterized protein LOC113004590 [Solenopsis invicta]|uniref:uncharacterized protein LOC113004590 n=1 Tax=Solenopsis invicta TaxID=13686 RepID=UPI00193E94B2|nr:uncharacterized protein LOC113004590 [Solenopsis invicta]
MTLNPKNVLKLLAIAFDDLHYDFESVISEAERNLSFHIESLIKDAIQESLYIETYTTLNFDEEDIIQDAVSIEENNNDNYIQDTVTSNLSASIELTESLDEEYKQKVIKFWKSGKKHKLKFATVQARFKRVSSKQQLYTWEKEISEGGNTKEKLKKLSEYVLSQFEDALQKCLPIHDLDICRWALNARNQLQLSEDFFKASDKWIHNFKQKHHIVSRKINKFITQKSLTNVNKLKTEASNFVEKVKTELLLIGAENVFNSDQSGFNLEMHTGRTLSFRGKQKIETLTQSISSMTHSYTIQPIISASGSLLSPLLIILQEKDGKFGPQVEQNLFRADNVVALPSNSDSWSGQNSKQLETIDTLSKNIKILTIPAGTTGMIQPLDVFGFRIWKNYIKHFSDMILLYNYDVNLHLRNNIIKLQSLIHNQFSSPRFINLFKYSWYKSGYLQEKPPKFDNPVDYCFKNCEAICASCNNVAIIKCAWCANSLCINEFFFAYHYCKNYKQ